MFLIFNKSVFLAEGRRKTVSGYRCKDIPCSGISVRCFAAWHRGETRSHQCFDDHDRELAINFRHECCRGILCINQVVPVAIAQCP